MKVGDLVRSRVAFDYGAHATGWITREHPLYRDAVWVSWLAESSVVVIDGTRTSPGGETLVYKDKLELVET